jgi:ArsR family transcriptional regulator, lead/cadmium/zinc/bismuth-responsive transcriptional repressor
VRTFVKRIFHSRLFRQLMEALFFIPSSLDIFFLTIYHSNMHLNELAKMMRVVGDGHRLSILCHLMKREQLCVSEIASDLELSIATTSHHLQVLAEENLVFATRDGKRICYELQKTPLVWGLKKFICAHSEFSSF